MKAVIFGGIVVAAVILTVAGSPADISTITIGGSKVKVEIADEPDERFYGLSGRPALPLNAGMLFVFETTGRYPFVMRDMRFGLDFLWIDENRRIVHIDENIPESYPDQIISPIPIRYVLEVNAGWAKANKVRAGERVEIAKKR